MNSFKTQVLTHTWLSLFSEAEKPNLKVNTEPPSLTQKQEEKVSSILNSEFASRSRTFRLQDIDSVWYNNEDWTRSQLKALIKKGSVSQVLWKTSYTSFRFEVRYHFPQSPFSSDIDAIRGNKAYYQPIDAKQKTYQDMLKSSTLPLSTKQHEIVSILKHNYGSDSFTRNNINALYWENKRNPKAKVSTFAHQLLHLVAKGQLIVIDGSHLTGPYRLANLQTKQELRHNIYNATLSLIGYSTDPWEFTS